MDNEDRDARWRVVIAMRPMLVRVGLAQGVSLEDAEDAAQEAMLRAVASDSLDMNRAEAWLTRVTQRLCIDRHRQHTRDLRIQRRMASADTPCPPAEDAICERALGVWALRHTDVLAPRERDVLFARAEGHDAATTARILGLTYKSAESAYTRARAKMRAAVRAALGTLGLLRLGRPRRGGAVVLTAAPVAAVFALQMTLGPFAPWAHSRPAEHRQKVAVKAPLAPVTIATARPRTRHPNSPTVRPVAPRVVPPPREVIDTQPVRVGPVHHDGARAGWQNEDESLEQTLARCLAKGVEITPQRIGCRD